MTVTPVEKPATPNDLFHITGNGNRVTSINALAKVKLKAMVLETDI